MKYWKLVDGEFIFGEKLTEPTWFAKKNLMVWEVHVRNKQGVPVFRKYCNTLSEVINLDKSSFTTVDGE